MKDFEGLLRQIESLVRAGQTAQAQRLLTGLNPNRIPRALRTSFASMCRRTDLVSLGLKIMAPIIQIRDGKWQESVTPKEAAEYAVLLQKTGALREALWILKQVDSPESLLYQAFCHINQFNYVDAVECLIRHGKTETVPYARFVGRVNLAASYVALEKREEAHELLNRNIEFAQFNGFTRLQANCTELRAQVHLQNKDLDHARADLHEAAKLLGEGGATDSFYIRKWSAMIEGIESRTLEPILQIREEALHIKQWEHVRVADSFALGIQFDQQRMDHLLFGTPYTHFRNHVLAQHPGRKAPETLLLGRDDGPIFDLRSGKFDDDSLETPTQANHRLLEILLRDFYRPSANGAVFAELFAGEYFDCNSSFHRVHQAVYRLRRWLEQNEMPIDVSEDQGSYSIRVTGRCGILIPFARAPVATDSLRLVSLQQRFHGSEFSMSESLPVLGLSKSSCKTLLSEAVAVGTLIRTGAGPSVRYRFKSAA